MLYLVWTGEGEKNGMKRSDTPELLPGTLYMMVLRTLARGPLHGYAIARRIKEASREGIEIEDG